MSTRCKHGMIHEALCPACEREPVEPFDPAPLRLLQLLRSRAEMCPMWAQRRKGDGPASHYYLIEPLDGQPYLAAGRHRYHCLYGCGFDKVITLDGTEAFRA